MIGVIEWKGSCHWQFVRSIPNYMCPNQSSSFGRQAKNKKTYQNTLALAVDLHGNWADTPPLATPSTHAPALPEHIKKSSKSSKETVQIQTCWKCTLLPLLFSSQHTPYLAECDRY